MAASEVLTISLFNHDICSVKKKNDMRDTDMATRLLDHTLLFSNKTMKNGLYGVIGNMTPVLGLHAVTR